MIRNTEKTKKERQNHERRIIINNKCITHHGTTAWTGSKYEPNISNEAAALNPGGIARTPFSCRKRRRRPGVADTKDDDIVIGARALTISNVDTKRYSFAELAEGICQRIYTE